MKQYNLIDDFNDIILCFDTNPAGIITFVSQAYCKTSGYKQEELIGKHHSFIKNEMKDPKTFEKLWEQLTQGSSFIVEKFSHLAKDGSIFYTKAKFAPILDDTHIIGYRSVQINITNEINDEIEKTIAEGNYLSAKHTNVKLQQNLREKEKSLLTFKNNFVSLFTHELKTPLNAIINFSDFIKRSLEKNNHSEKSLQKIHDLAIKIYNNGLKQQIIIDNLLDFAKIESGRLEVHKKYFLIFSIIEPIIKQFQGLYDKKVIYDIPTDAYVYGDPKICTMIFSNLYSNALKYSKSKVKITFIKLEDDFILSIEDDGDGIANENKKKVFEFFGQSNQGNVLNMEIKGSGIGLYTVKLLADICEKTITLEDSSQLGGAKFTIKGDTLND